LKRENASHIPPQEFLLVPFPVVPDVLLRQSHDFIGWKFEKLFPFWTFNTIASEAEMLLDMRSVDMRCLPDLERKVLAILERRTGTARPSWNWEGTGLLG
jgi:hypothetical protein